MKVLQDYRDEVRRLIKDDANRLSQEEYDSKIAAAIERYSRDRPYLSTYSITGDGVTYEWSLPDFFTIKKVEYPVDERVPNYLVKYDDWIIYNGMIRFLSFTPADGKEAKIYFTTSHLVTTDYGTIPDHDFEAVCQLAASYALLQLASFYAQTIDPTIDADAVAYRTKQREYLETAAEYERLYKLAITPEDVEVVPATRTKDWDVKLSTGQEPLFHLRR